jgi:hypothetical protein
MQSRPHIRNQALAGKVAGILVGVLVILMLFGADAPVAADAPPASEAQVKAVFLFNFAKYVDWPPTAFPSAAAPIVIGVLGDDPFGANLPHIVEGKIVNGHSFVIKHFAADSELNGCHILFICHSEAFRMEEILGKAGALPILTVGEDDQFAQDGGIISFVLKNGKVRLQINLTSAKKAGLSISSKLLAVADSVKGKSNN